ncbi:MAG TPA: urease accessory protein UreD, partial [Roseimicrobium sp.]|nr:urease accessory protein UreD [Roseimicrobium sp.]
PSFPATASPGLAGLRVSRVAGQSAVTECWAQSPLKLLTPRFRGPSVWAYTSSFGGGMVAGDQTRLTVDVDDSAVCFLGTQASTKVYRNPKFQPCSHHLTARIGANASLILSPDPVQCFAGSTYSQRQEFHLSQGAGLVLVDWLSAGRSARGERWLFDRFQSRNEVFRSGRRIFLDSLLLTGKGQQNPVLRRMSRYECLAMVLIVGMPFAAGAAATLERVDALPVERRTDFVLSASPVADGTVLRLAGRSTEQVAKEICRTLAFVTPMLKDDPWERKW